MAFAETQQLVVQLDLKGNLSSGLKNAASQLKGFDKATSRTQKSLGKFSSNIQKGVVLGATATAGAFLTVVKAASDYESAFAGVRKTVTATDAELDKLSDQFRALAKTIPISAAELARLGEAGGALGIPTADLEEFVRVTALLGVTTNLTAEEAADSLGILGNVLHLTGEEYGKFASALVALGNAGASTESEIIAIAERTGAAGELIGLSTAQVLGFSSAVASLGIEAEAGGSALQKFFIDTTKIVSKGGKELALFAKVSGTSAKAFRKAYDKDAGAALQRFLTGLGKLDQAAQIDVLEELGFNDVRITRTLLGLANNTTLLADQMGVANQAFEDNTALTKEADQRFKTFSSQLQITKNVLTDIAITIGSKLLPKLTPLLQKLNAFVSTHQGDIEKFGDDLASGFERFADAIGKVDWTPFIDGMRITSDAVKGIITVFQSLPADVQKLIVAGVAINKVTGGLITSITKDLAGAGLKLIFERGSSPANPLWVQQVGVPGAAGGIIPGGGKLAGAASLLSKVFIVGAAAEFASLISGPLNDVAVSIHDSIFQGPLEGIGNFFEGLGKGASDMEWPFGPKNAPEWASGKDIPIKFGGQLRLDGAPIVTPITNALGQINDSAETRSLNERAANIASAEGIKQEARAAASKNATAAASIKAAVDAAKSAQVAAEFQTQQAIHQKDLSVTTNVTVPVAVSVRGIGNATVSYKKYGGSYAS